MPTDKERENSPYREYWERKPIKDEFNRLCDKRSRAIAKLMKVSKWDEIQLRLKEWQEEDEKPDSLKNRYLLLLRKTTL